MSQTPITITNTSVPLQGDTFRYSSPTFQQIQAMNYLQTGSNYYWDYSNLIPQTQGVYQYKPAFQTPYGFYFIGANKYGLKVADTLGAGQFTFTDVYNFYTSSTANFRTEGIGFKYAAVTLPLAGFYSDDDEIYQFPLNYGDRDSSTYAFSVAIGTTLSYSQRGYRINEVDGWGIIKTPYDSIKCLRVISTSYGVDSINFNGFGFPFPNIQRSYKWLANSVKIPVLEVSGNVVAGSFTPNQVRYRDVYRNLTGINQLENPSQAVLIYPNPSNGKFLIDVGRLAKYGLEVWDGSGKMILNFSGTEKISLVDLSVFCNGIYYLKVLGEGGEILSVQRLMNMGN